MAILDTRTRGHYIVGWKLFFNKIEALQYASHTGFTIRWSFNDDVYSSMDWTIPIEKSLKELYKERAQQLREQYDWIVLHFSGGQDSIAMLHAFIDNGIHLDQISIQAPESMRQFSNGTTTTFDNFWAELDYQSIPYLKKHSAQLSKTKIEIFDSSKSASLFDTENWTDILAPSTSFHIGLIARAMCQYTDKYVMKLSEQGKKSCQLMGIDKPKVHINGDDYYCLFSDQDAYHIPPARTELLGHYEQSTVEFFYWTPSLPQIVIKQAQEIKLACITNPMVKKIFAGTLSENIATFRPLMQSIIYDVNHACDFQTDKSPTATNTPSQHRWFFEGEPEHRVRNYNYAIGMAFNKILPKYFINEDSNAGLNPAYSKFYKL